MENETKPWFKSRTIWAAIGIIVMTVADQYGVDVDASTVADTLFNLATAIAAAATIAGRLVAKRQIKNQKANP